ncbi:MAG: superoxide dismutase family protein [Hyphomicrobiales bacterium]|nr:superoxide dismutase family protein [Hyphomicrobiales bacterium]
MHMFIKAATAIVGATLVFSSAASAQQGGMTAKVSLVDATGKAMGTAQLTQVEKGVLVDLDLKGVPPGAHGIHIHQTGKCDGAAKFTSAGGHFTVASQEHGYHSSKGPHAGDMPNLMVPESGALKQQIFTPGVTLGAGDNSVFDADGSALVIHAKGDDYRSQPAGDSGDRIACGVIEK